MTPHTSRAHSDLRQRVLSAVVIAPAVLGAVWLGGIAFLLMVAIAVILMAYEWSRVTCAESWRVDMGVLSLTVLVSIAAVVAPNSLPVQGVIVTVVMLGAAVASLIGVVVLRPQPWRVIGIPYLVVGVSAIVWLRMQDGGLGLTLWLLASIWAMDIGAYFAGRTIGGPKLAPRASPNKTWSGLLGGMLAAGLVGAGASFLIDDAPIPAMIVVSAALGGWSQVGDIAESAVKRHFGVKDMSNLIPGHGGILDRVDGLLFAAPMMAMAVAWLLPAWR